MQRWTILRVCTLAVVLLVATWRGAFTREPSPPDVALTHERARSLEYLSLYLDEFSRRSVLEGRIDEGVTAIVERMRLFDDPAAGAAGRRVLTALDRVVRAPGFDGIFDNGASVEILAADAQGRVAVSGEAKGRISVWDVAEGVRIAHLPDMEKPAELSVSSDGQYAFGVGTTSGEIHVWHIAAVRRTAIIAAPRATRSDWSRFVGGGRSILLKRGDATTLHDVETGREVARLAGTADPAQFMNDAAVVTHSGQRAMLWNAVDGRRIAEVDAGDKVVVAAMSGRLLIVRTVAGKVSVFEVPGGRRLRIIDVRPRPLAVGGKTGRFAPPAPYDIFVDGRGLRMVSGDDGAARLWDLSTGNPIADLWVESRPAGSVTWTPQATFLANDTRVLLHGGGAFPSALWNAETGDYMLTYVFSGRMADNLRAVGPGRGSFVTTDDDDGLLFVEAGSGRRYARIPDDDPLWTVVVPAGPDTLLCYRRIDRQIRRFRLPPADISSEIAGLPARDLEAATALPDGRLVVGDNDGGIHLFHPRSGAPAAYTMVSPGAEKIKALSSSSDGSRVVAVAGDAVVLLDTDGLRPLAEFGGPGRKKDASVTFSPDGRRVAVYHPYGAMLWDATDGRTIAELAKPGERNSRRPSPDALESAAFDPVGSRLAVVRSQRNATEVLDALSGTVVTRVPTRPIAPPLWIDGGRRLALATAKAVFAIDFAGETSIAWASEPGLSTELAASPDGDMLAGAAGDGALVLWEANTGKRVGTVDLSHLSPNTPSVRALWFAGGPDRVLARMNSMSLDEPDSLLLLDVSAFPARVLATEPLPAHIDPLPIGADRLAFPDEEIRIIDTRSGHLVSQLAPGPGPRIPLAAQKVVLVVAGGVARRVPTELSASLDLVPAFRLYQTLFEAIIPQLDGVQHLIVSGDQPFSTIPLPLIVTEPRLGDRQGERPVAWLARRFAVSVVPSPDFLVSLRASPTAPRRERRPFLGIGAPQLNATAQPASDRPIVDVFGHPDAAALRALGALPDTVHELSAISAALGGRQDDLLLGDRATEAMVRSMPLADYAVLAFATHGLVSGDIGGLRQPSLVLTPGDPTDTAGDGFLTASEIIGLNLDADLAVLSACNTAGPDGSPRASYLSGLAKAFLYAGARSLLVSHWPVRSASAAELTSRTLVLAAREPNIRVSEALRRTMLDFADGGVNPAWQHPIHWAPFVLVGDGRPLDLLSTQARQ